MSKIKFNIYIAVVLIVVILITLITILINLLSPHKQTTETTCLEKALAGNFSCYSGDYIYTSGGYSKTITFNKEGTFAKGIGIASAQKFRNDGKPISINREGEMLRLTYIYYWSDDAWIGHGEHQFKYYLVPQGVEYDYQDFSTKTGELETKSTDITRVRIVDHNCDGCISPTVYYQDKLNN